MASRYAPEEQEAAKRPRGRPGWVSPLAGDDGECADDDGIQPEASDESVADSTELDNDDPAKRISYRFPLQICFPGGVVVASDELQPQLRLRKG